MGTHVEVKVDVNKTSLLDIIVEYEELGKKQRLKLDYAYPTFDYVFMMKHHKLESDKDLMKMFKRFSDASEIPIWVGTVLKPTPFYKLVLHFKRAEERKKRTADHEDEHEVEERLPSLEDLEDRSVNVRQQGKKIVEITASQKATTAKKKPPPKKKTTTTAFKPPAPISPKTAFKSLPIRGSPRFSPLPNTTSFEPTNPPPFEIMFARKVPRTTTIRKGISVTQATVTQATVTPEVIVKDAAPKEKLKAKRRMTFDEEACDENEEFDNEFDNDAESDNDVIAEGDIPSDERGEINSMPKIKDTVRHPRIRDQSKAGKATTALKKKTSNQTKKGNTSQSTEINMSQCPPSQSQP
ncbi:hypothetical protein ACET3Z_011741 [Daucus carota]